MILVVLATNGSSGNGSTTASSGFTGGDFHSLVADPSTPGRLFAGGHQAVSTSTDGGATWQRVTALDNADAMGWGFAEGKVWVSGHPGLNRSTDNTSTFERRNGGLPDTDIHSFGASPGALYAAGPGVGVIVSTDGATTWTSRTDQAGRSFFGRIIIDAANPDHLVAADARTGPVDSSDGGRTWRTLASFPATWVSTPDGMRTLYASSPDGAIRSLDGGATWTPMSLPEGATLDEAAPTTPGRLYAARHEGDAVSVWVSTDGGETWRQP